MADLIKALQIHFAISESQVLRLIARSPHTYKIYTIPKKSGGNRVIAQPAKETKLIQWWLLENTLKKLPIHTCATAFKLGSGIRENANRHRKNQYLTKLDFKNFFYSISENDIATHLRRYLRDAIGETEIAQVSRVVCIKLKESSDRCLSIGAPTSPLLSNSVMHDFDCELTNWCNSNNITYSRYADDLSLSSNVPNLAPLIEPKIRSIIDGLAYPRLQLNTKKTIHLSMKFQRRITGIIVNNEGGLSIGRSRKRYISSMIHHFKIGVLPEDEKPKLQGLIAFAKDIEPTFIESMRKKYGATVMKEVFELRKTPISQ